VRPTFDDVMQDERGKRYDYRPSLDKWDREVWHESQPAARAGAEEECRENPGSTFVLETEGYLVARGDWTWTFHRVREMHPYSADH